jgi:hypothetical protein
MYAKKGEDASQEVEMKDADSDIEDTDEAKQERNDIWIILFCLSSITLATPKRTWNYTVRHSRAG